MSRPIRRTYRLYLVIEIEGDTRDDLPTLPDVQEAVSEALDDVTLTHRLVPLDWEDAPS